MCLLSNRIFIFHSKEERASEPTVYLVSPPNAPVTACSKCWGVVVLIFDLATPVKGLHCALDIFIVEVSVGVHLVLLVHIVITFPKSEQRSTTLTEAEEWASLAKAEEGSPFAKSEKRAPLSEPEEAAALVQIVIFRHHGWWVGNVLRRNLPNWSLLWLRSCQVLKLGHWNMDKRQEWSMLAALACLSILSFCVSFSINSFYETNDQNACVWKEGILYV